MRFLGYNGSAARVAHASRHPRNDTAETDYGCLFTD